MKIAITGGNGRLGTALIRYLMEEEGSEHSICNLDWREPEHPSPYGEQVQFKQVDLTDLDVVLEAVKGCEAIAHLAAYTHPYNPPGETFRNNALGSLHVLNAAVILGIPRVCLASSVNAIGGFGSRIARYDYFPVDEEHPTYSEDDYALSKWVMEQQADSYARRQPGLTISSLRFHALPDEAPEPQEVTARAEDPGAHTLWGWTLMSEAARACWLALQAAFSGHEVFFITAPRTAANRPSLELATEAYPQVPVRGDLSGFKSFYNCEKAAQLLGWEHMEI